MKSATVKLTTTDEMKNKPRYDLYAKLSWRRNFKGLQAIYLIPI